MQRDRRGTFRGQTQYLEFVSFFSLFKCVAGVLGDGVGARGQGLSECLGSNRFIRARLVEQGIVGLLASLAEVRGVLVAVAGVVLAEAPKAAVALSDEVESCGGRKV